MKSSLSLLFLVFTSCYHSDFTYYKPATVLSVTNKRDSSFFLSIENEYKIDTFFIPDQRAKIKINLKPGMNIIKSNYYTKELFVRTGVEYRKIFR